MCSAILAKLDINKLRTEFTLKNDGLWKDVGLFYCSSILVEHLPHCSMLFLSCLQGFFSVQF